MDKIERINRELIVKGHIFNYYHDTMKIPNGNIVKWDFIGHNGAAAIIPITEDNKICLVRQFRNALDRETLEIPAGGLLNANESTLDAAIRELEEETGYKSNHVEFLISIRTAVAFCNEKIDIYIAKNLISGKQNLDEDEFIEIEKYSITDVMEMIYSGQIEDSKTISAIFAYHHKYCLS